MAGVGNIFSCSKVLNSTNSPLMIFLRSEEGTDGRLYGSDADVVAVQGGVRWLRSTGMYTFCSAAGVSEGRGGDGEGVWDGWEMLSLGLK